MSDEFAAFLISVIDIAKEAGKKILPYFTNPHYLNVQHKLDQTPVTEADLVAHSFIVSQLLALNFEVPVLSEEDIIPYEIRKHWNRYWLVDPLDGTQGFLRHCEEFTVNIALIENHQPILGVIYSPVSEELYYAYSGGGSYYQLRHQEALRIHSRAIHWSHVKALLGQYHSVKRVTELTSRFEKLEIIRLNSSLKFGYLAQGKADFYFRQGDTGEWDTAAGQIILQEAGGEVVDLSGQPLHYNVRDSLINPHFLAIGSASEKKKILNILKEEKS